MHIFIIFPSRCPLLTAQVLQGMQKTHLEAWGSGSMPAPVNRRGQRWDAG